MIKLKNSFKISKILAIPKKCPFVVDKVAVVVYKFS